MDQWQYQPAKDLGLTHTQRVRSLRRESGLAESLLHHGWWLVAKCYLKLRHRLRVIDPQNLPTQPPFILIANHSSHLDAFVLGAALPRRLSGRVFPIAAGDVFFTHPAAATFSAMMMNLLPMWRHHCGPHALKDLRLRLLEQPCGYILFPEGKRTRDGSLLPFKSGIGMIVAGTEVPVVPCHIEGAMQAWPADAPRPGRGRVTLRIGQPITFRQMPDSREGWNAISQQLREAVEAMAIARVG